MTDNSWSAVAQASAITVEKLYMSDNHFYIQYRANSFVKTDMNTASDTYLNCMQITDDERHGKELHNDDLIGFGEDG